MLKHSIKKYYFSSALNLGKMSFKPQPVINPDINGKKYDLAIIGGGSGGISLAYVKIQYYIYIINCIYYFYYYYFINRKQRNKD